MKGAIYINTDNYGIHAVEFEMNRKYIDKLEKTFVQRNARGYSVKPKSIKYRVGYKYMNNRYFLSHVRGDMEFFARKKKKIFGNTYNLFFEMAVNSVDTVNVKRYARDERAPLHTVFSETINNYDPAFWGTDNFLRPEEDIQEALVRIGARLSRFTNNSQ